MRGRKSKKMLSNEEKKEMLEDARNLKRRDAFRRAQAAHPKLSFDEYLLFLNNVQEIFSPFSVSRKSTITKYNKL